MLKIRNLLVNAVELLFLLTGFDIKGYNFTR